MSPFVFVAGAAVEDEPPNRDILTEEDGWVYRRDAIEAQWVDENWNSETYCEGEEESRYSSDGCKVHQQINITNIVEGSKAA